MSLNKKIFLFLIVFVSIIFSGCSLNGDIDYKELYKQILPEVKNITGKEFDAVPELEIASVSDIKEIFAEDFRPQFEKLYKGQSEEVIESALKIYVDGYSENSLGKYSFKRKKFYLIPENLKRIFDMYSLKNSSHEDIMRLSIIHELTHAKQDEIKDLAKFISGLDKIDEISSFNAIIEGMAMASSKAYAEKNGMKKAFKDFQRLVIPYYDSETNNKYPGIQHNVEVVKQRFIYNDGLNFIQHFIDKNGWEKAWDIYLNPPKMTHMIRYPELYKKGVSSDKELVLLLKIGAAALTDKNRNINVNEAGYLGLLTSLSVLSEEDNLAGAEFLKNGAVMTVNAGQIQIIVTLMRLNEKANPKKVLDVYEKYSLKEVELAERLRGAGFKNKNSRTLDEFDFPANLITFEIVNGDTAIPQHIARFVSNNILAEVIHYNIKDESAAIETLKSLIPLVEDL